MEEKQAKIKFSTFSSFPGNQDNEIQIRKCPWLCIQ